MHFRSQGLLPNSTHHFTFFSTSGALLDLVDEFKFTILNTVALMKTYPGSRGLTHSPESELTFHSELKLLVVVD